MKTLLSILAIALAGVFVSCDEKDPPVVEDPKMEVAPTEIVFDAEGTVTKTVTVLGTGWSATKTGDWFSISADSGEAGGTFTVSTTANTSIDGLNGSILVKSTTEGVDNVTITVTQPGRDKVDATAVALDAETAHIYYLGPDEETTRADSDEKPATITLTPTLTPANADNTITWTVAPEGIVTVEDGVVTAVKPGIATVTATAAEGVTASCEVTVTTECGFIIADTNEPTTMTWAMAQTGCPEGWRLPEFSELICMCETNRDGKDGDITYAITEGAGFYWSNSSYNDAGRVGMQTSFNPEAAGISYCMEIAIQGIDPPRNVRCIKDVAAPAPQARCYVTKL